MGGKPKREGIYVYIQLIYIVVYYKLTQHCKAIIYQKKKASLTEGQTGGYSRLTGQGSLLKRQQSS